MRLMSFVATPLIVLLLGLPAKAESCQSCQAKVQASVAACQAALPPEVKPADPRHPTEAEKKAAKERAAKAQACPKIALDGFANCRKTAGCP